jgi:hypothetical protein
MSVATLDTGTLEHDDDRLRIIKQRQDARAAEQAPANVLAAVDPDGPDASDEAVGDEVALDANLAEADEPASESNSSAEPPTPPACTDITGGELTAVDHQATAIASPDARTGVVADGTDSRVIDASQEATSDAVAEARGRTSRASSKPRRGHLRARRTRSIN